MTNKIIIANWKMNHSFDQAEQWLESIHQKISGKNNLPVFVLCPPAILIDYLDELLMEKELNELNQKHQNLLKMPEEELENMMFKIRNLHLGGQNCHYAASGAFTGDISAKMLKDCGCEYVILGHSESRQYHFESDEIIAKKIKSAAENKLIPILCVGESTEIRGEKKHCDFILNQLEKALAANQQLAQLIIAYEPIWSIGTATIPQIAEIEEIAGVIDDYLRKTEVKKYQILYGGSVNKNNAQEICAAVKIDGLLVGGASLDAASFVEIAEAITSF